MDDGSLSPTAPTSTSSSTSSYASRPPLSSVCTTLVAWARSRRFRQMESPSVSSSPPSFPLSFGRSTPLFISFGGCSTRSDRYRQPLARPELLSGLIAQCLSSVGDRHRRLRGIESKANREFRTREKVRSTQSIPESEWYGASAERAKLATSYSALSLSLSRGKRTRSPPLALAHSGDSYPLFTQPVLPFSTDINAFSRCGYRWKQYR